MQKFFEALNLTNKKQTEPQKAPSQPRVTPYRSKEISENTKEEEKINISGDFKNFKFELKVFGKSIFQNLILTASAYTDNEERETIPIKCTWRRVKRDIAVYIPDLNSNSYMPSAEDIGYTIEVEAVPIENSVYTGSALGQWGPITLDEDMKNTIELLLTSGGTKFSCYIFDIKEQEKVTDREILLYINSNEFRVVETDYNGKEKVLESLKYHPFNPMIKLHSYDAYRFTIKIFDYEFGKEANYNGGSNPDKLSEIPKAEYHLIAMSKQCRELIYLLSGFFLIDEKLKNSKLFSVVNYNLLPAETKVGVIDLISEIKTLREENNIYMKNMKNLEKSNRELKFEMKNLEEDFQITLESINNPLIIRDANARLNYNSQMFKVNNDLDKLSSQCLNCKDTNKKIDELTELREVNSTLISKEKALREENRNFGLENEIMKNNIFALTEELKKLNNDLGSKEQDLISIRKSCDYLNDSKVKLQSLYDSLVEDNRKFKIFYEDNSKSIDKLKKENDDSLNNLKNKINELQKTCDTLQYENKNLILQKNLLTNQKEIIVKEFEKLKKEKNSNEENNIQLLEEVDNLKSVIREKENINLHINGVLENIKKEKEDLKANYELLEIEYTIVKEHFDKMFTQKTSHETGKTVQISEEEYEEYDMLKKEKDEQDALIMQLKSNSDAKDLEIKSLKMLLDNFKK